MIGGYNLGRYTDFGGPLKDPNLKNDPNASAKFATGNNNYRTDIYKILDQLVAASKACGSRGVYVGSMREDRLGPAVTVEIGGARFAGVVFNRALARDFARSISGISLRSIARQHSTSGSANGRTNGGNGTDVNVLPFAGSMILPAARSASIASPCWIASAASGATMIASPMLMQLR